MDQKQMLLTVRFLWLQEDILFSSNTNTPTSASKRWTRKGETKTRLFNVLKNISFNFLTKYTGLKGRVLDKSDSENNRFLRVTIMTTGNTSPPTMINYCRCSTVIGHLLLRAFSIVSFSKKSLFRVIWPKKGQSISLEELACLDQ